MNVKLRHVGRAMVASGLVGTSVVLSNHATTDCLAGGAAPAATTTPDHHEANTSQADPGTKSMPLGWRDAHVGIITSPDEAALERGDILFAAREDEDGNTTAQTIGLIDASPEVVMAILRAYRDFARTMPFTERCDVVREFVLEGPNDPGAEAVDVRTRIKVGGFTTGYLLRIAHLADPEAHRYRIYWTLLRDAGNDLATNVGSHRIEPYQGDPSRTKYTYTLKLRGKNRVQEMTLWAGRTTSMRSVTTSVRAEARRQAERP